MESQSRVGRHEARVRHELIGSFACSATSSTAATPDCPDYLATMPTCIPTPIAWTSSHAVRILDQTLLPTEEAYRDLETVEGVAEAIRRSGCAGRR